MSKTHLIVGPVGAGKSTYAIALCASRRALRLTLDEWMVELFRPDRPEADIVRWYRERAARCISQIFRIAVAARSAGVETVLEIGLIQRAERMAFYERLERAGFDYKVYLLDAPREVRRARVLARNAAQGDTFSMIVPAEVFELASDMWQPPDDDERASRNIVDVS